MTRIGKIIEDNINNLRGNQLPAALKEIVKL